LYPAAKTKTDGVESALNAAVEVQMSKPPLA
jgi:hypothetical protein